MKSFGTILIKCTNGLSGFRRVSRPLPNAILRAKRRRLSAAAVWNGKENYFGSLHETPEFVDIHNIVCINVCVRGGGYSRVSLVPIHSQSWFPSGLDWISGGGWSRIEGVI